MAELNKSDTYYTLDTYYDINTMKKFYQFLDFTHFRTLSLERMNEIDEIITKYRNETKAKYKNRMSVMGITANKLMSSSTALGLQNGDEIAYFYIKAVDEKMLYLEIANLAENKDELKELCKRQFGVYDNVIIQLEKYLVNHLDTLQIEKDAEISI